MPILRHLLLVCLTLPGCQGDLSVSGEKSKSTRTQVAKEETANQSDDNKDKVKDTVKVGLAVKADPEKTVCATTDTVKLKGAKLCVSAGTVSETADVTVSFSAAGDLRLESEGILQKPVELTLPESLYNQLFPDDSKLVFITDDGQESALQGVKQPDGSYLIKVSKPGRLVVKASDPTPKPTPTPSVPPVTPNMPTINASADAADGIINIAESGSSTPIFTTGSLDSGATAHYTNSFVGLTCPAASMFTLTAPPSPSDFTSDGSYSVCIRIVGADSGENKQIAMTLTVDLSPPIFTSLSGANEASDHIIDASEFSSTLPAFAAVLGSDISTTAYSNFLDANSSPNCGSGQTYNLAAVPNISDISSDGSWLICVRLTDSNGNTTYGTSATIQRATTIPNITTFTAEATSSTEIKVKFVADELPVTSHNLLKIVRSAGSATAGVTAPSCDSGTVIASYNAPISTSTIFDSGLTTSHYYSYRACYSDKFGNESNGSTVVDIQATGPAAHRIWDMADMDGNKTQNSGDISSSTSTSVADASGNNHHGTLGNFDFDILSGWKGNGTTGSPYRLVFDGTNDRVYNNSFMAATKTYAFWIKVKESQANCDDANVSYIISRRDSGFNFGSVEACASGFVTTYNDSDAWGGTSLGSGWNHIATIYSGGAQLVYVNGIYVNQVVSTEENQTEVMSLGSKYDSAVGMFSGEMALFEAYPTALSPAQARDLFERERSRFESEISTPTVKRIVGSYASTSGGSTATIYGWKLDGVQKVTIGGVPAAFTVETKGSVKVTLPALTAGSHDIVLIFTSGSPLTLSGAYDAVDSADDAIVLRLDAARPDSVASGHSGEFWHSLTNGHQMTAKGFDNGPNSGWKGAGTTSDPYRFSFDGTDDYFVVSTGNPLIAASVWFHAHTIDAYCDYRQIFFKYNWNAYKGTGIYPCQNNRLYAFYMDTIEQYTTISTNTWYHFAMTHNGTHVFYYLNGVQFGTGAVSVETNPGELYLGSSRNSSDTFDGDVALFTQYSRHLTPEEVSAIYDREKVRFP